MTQATGPAGGAWRPHADVVVGSAVLALCALVYAATYSFDEVAAVISLGMGPGAFPRLVLSVMAALAALLIWQSRHRAPEPAEPVPPMVIYTALLLLGFMFAVAAIGMLAAMFVLVVAMGWVWGQRRLFALAAAAGLLCLAVWGIFVRGFGVPLPGGLAGRLLF